MMLLKKELQDARQFMKDGLLGNVCDQVVKYKAHWTIEELDDLINSDAVQNDNKEYYTKTDGIYGCLDNVIRFRFFWAT